jgi:hypothetical protein
MNVEHNRNDQPPEPGLPKEDAARMVHWQQLIKSVQALRPEFKQLWYDLRLMPGAP